MITTEELQKLNAETKLIVNEILSKFDGFSYDRAFFILNKVRDSLGGISTVHLPSNGQLPDNT